MRLDFDSEKSARLRADPRRGVGFEEAAVIFEQDYYLVRRRDDPEQCLALGWIAAHANLSADISENSHNYGSNSMAKYLKSVAVPELTDAMYQRGRKALKAEPFDVVRARYNPVADTVDLTLRKGIKVALPRLGIRELATSDAADLKHIEIQPGGDGITFRAINVDIYVPGLLADKLSTLFAKANGRKSRGKTSPRKAAAAQKNGRRGGRPRKEAA